MSVFGQAVSVYAKTLTVFLRLQLSRARLSVYNVSGSNVEPFESLLAHKIFINHLYTGIFQKSVEGGGIFLKSIFAAVTQTIAYRFENYSTTLENKV